MQSWLDYSPERRCGISCHKFEVVGANVLEHAFDVSYVTF